MLSISKLGLLVQPEVVHLHPQPVSSPDPPGCRGGTEGGREAGREGVREQQGLSQGCKGHGKEEQEAGLKQAWDP